MANFSPVADPTANPANKPTLVSLANLSKYYEEAGQQRMVLHPLQLTIRQGDFVVLLGKSGSGKSTLLNLIGGIDQPSSGTIEINGVSLGNLPERQLTRFRREHIGFIFQFFNLIPTLTALENISLPFELKGSRREGEQRAHQLLEKVGLADRAHTYPDRLSGGEQQRIAIARALIHEPLLLLADEPTGNLDEENGEKVLQLLLSLSRNRGKTLIMATHNPEIVRYADVVYTIYDGKISPRKGSAEI
jgi:putative ABC transport system ATP-binding protein